MNLQAIYVANITGFLLIMFLLISQYITYKGTRTEDKIFSWMMYLVLFACLVEPWTFKIDGKPGVINHWINLIGNTYLYGANAVGSFLFCVYVDANLYHSRERLKKIYNKFAGFVILLLLSLLINIPCGYYFNVDANNVYHREVLVSLFYIYTMVCSIYSVGVLYKHRFKYGKVAFFPIFVYLIPIVSGSVLQMFFYGISLAWLGTAIGIVALYMSMLSRSSYLDSLTKLYNRLYLKNMINRIKTRAVTDYYGIMIDMDRFKAINDTYGHSAGDQALKDAAFIFRQAAQGTNASIFRFAGDEFVILIRTSDEAEVTDFENRLYKEMDAFNETSDRPYKVGFSMGHAPLDCVNDTQDSFLKKIDTAMYENKAKRREEDGFERRKKND